MKSFLSIICLVCLFSCSFKQKNGNDNPSINFKGSELEKIETSLKNGDKSAFYRLAPFLDSTKNIEEYIPEEGDFKTPEKKVAAQLLDENSAFLKSELILNDSLSTKQFTTFLQQHYAAIKFDKDADTYFITPLANRDVKYELSEQIEERKSQLRSEQNKLIRSEWAKKNKIDKFISKRNPYALFAIAAVCYRERERYHSDGGYNKKEYIDLLENLVGADIGVENDQGKMDFHIERNYNPIVRLNLLIYFAKNYKFYKWDDKLKIFYNKYSKIEPLSQETKYFQLLTSKTDSVALNAYIKLTTCNPQRVAEIAKEYDKANIEKNFELPTSVYGFLEEIPFLTQYYKVNHIDFQGSDKLREEIIMLRKDIGFRPRRDLENKMIREMTFDDACALEYWSFIYESGYNDLTFSAGRILDIYYSNNWDNIIVNKKLLDAYLKKSFLFYWLSEKYLEKFIGANPAQINIIRHNTSDDKDITYQSAKALAKALKKKVLPTITKKFNEGNYDTTVTNLEKQFSVIIRSTTDSEKREQQIGLLFSRINYNQIGQALRLIENIKFSMQWYKYSFIERDYGFFMDDFENPTTRRTFLNYYSTHTEKQLYQYYLERAGIDYQKPDKSLDYDNIYELLKYDVVTAIPAGGAGTQDNEVYCIIKLLEMQFNTTLGYPRKLCNSDGTNGCDSSDRAKEWMEFLKNKGLLKLSHNTPLSFSYYGR